MQALLDQLHTTLVKGFEELYGSKPDEKQIQIQKTRKEFEGDFTLNVFPFLRITRSKPEDTAQKLGDYLRDNIEEIKDYNVIKGFLNLSLSENFWRNTLKSAIENERFGLKENSGRTVLVEFASPNTNKPLHLGHLRNIFLGYSVSKILKANGHDVVNTQIINDRGIHICKSMVAWKEYGNGQTPEEAGQKGDHFVGDYYVKFDQVYKEQIKELVSQGVTEDDAKEQAPIMKQARETLSKWEQGDEETVALWERMNNWVYQGFDVTYNTMGVDFDKLYYESETYLKGRDVVKKGLKEGNFFEKDNGSIWVDLTGEGLDEKLLLRADGTAVYMTQDIGTAIQRSEDFPRMHQMVYTVGNEQDYHFQVLFKILDKLGYDWAKNCYHLSYGMVELPDGRMKSREGNVVDADDIMKEMMERALEQGKDRGSYEEMPQQEREELARKVGMAALKYFILKVDPKKNMTFNPEESVDMNGNTGPFIQYTYARTASILRKAGEVSLDFSDGEFDDKERELVKMIASFPELIEEAGEQFNPGAVANYCYDLAKTYNGFYQNTPIFGADDQETINWRLGLTKKVGDILKTGMGLLGVEMPERF
ncbi:MAG: arginine--tRNA ligase [Salibacter sp.]|uniref:arginine--tRNA ligase n=1 Tax=Salibacter sp. TaxID=2010995 RepID=UPI0028708809|nr:arginine--tRNA ligase [Salibacter sp.]MDR9398850.1 arginine--tRNA ligase [Salibacter sp.]